MGLDLNPDPIICKSRGFAKLTPEGNIDCDATDCPFKDDHNPRSFRSTYCWFSGRGLEIVLEDLGEAELAERLHKDCSAEEAEAFGQELLVLASRIRRYFDGVTPKNRPKHSQWDVYFDEQGKQWRVNGATTLEEALQFLEAGGRWFQKVASFQSGAHAWG